MVNKVQNYCVYLNNWPFINNRGKLAMCCKNDRIDITPAFGNIKNTPLKELWHSAHINYWRSKIKNYEMPVGCQGCYNHEEKINDFSFRMRSLYGVHQQVDNMDWEDPRMKIPYKDLKIRALDLRVGNLCNLACIMCHPSDSSRWYGNYEKFDREVNRPNKIKGEDISHFERPNHLDHIKEQHQPKLLNWAEDNSCWQNIFNSIDLNLKKVYMAGGEPFYIKNFESYVNELLGYAPEALIDINTNGTRWLDEKYISRLKNHMRIRVSVDGYGKMDEFHRVGTIWNEKLKVMDQYYKHFGIRSIDITMTALSIRGVPELIKFVVNRYPETRIMMRPVINKKGLNIEDIPVKMRQPVIDFLDNLPKAKEYIGHADIMHRLRKPDNFDVTTNKNILKDYIKYNESLSNVNYIDIDPTLYEWIHNG